MVIGKPERSIQIEKYVAKIHGGTPAQTCFVRENSELMQCKLSHLEPSTTYAILVEACLYADNGCGQLTKVSFQTRGKLLHYLKKYVVPGSSAALTVPCFFSKKLKNLFIF